MLRRPILVLAIALAATPVSAQDRNAFEVGLFARYSIFDASLSMENQLGAGGRLSAFLFPNLLFEADLSYTSTADAGDEAARYVPFHAYVVYGQPLSPRTSLRLGAGWAHNEYPHGADNGAAGLVSLQVLLQPSLALRVDGTFDFMPAPANRNATNFNPGLQAGLSFPIGRVGSPSPAPGPVVIGMPTPPQDRPEAPPDGDAGEERSPERVGGGDSGASPRSDSTTITPPDTAGGVPAAAAAATRPDTAGGIRADSAMAPKPDSVSVIPADSAVAPRDNEAAGQAAGAARLPADTPVLADTATTTPRSGVAAAPVDTGAGGLMESADTSTAPEPADSTKVRMPVGAATGVVSAPDTSVSAEATDPTERPNVAAAPDTAGIGDIEARRPREASYARTSGFAVPPAGESVILDVVFAGPRTAMTAPPSHSRLNAVAAAVLNGPPGAIYEVAGYTDDTGNTNFNERLSLARANVVMWYLLDRGVPAQRLVAKGYGPADPRASNATEAGRAQNRRVELRRLR